MTEVKEITMKSMIQAKMIILCFILLMPAMECVAEHSVPEEHPRLFGSAEYLKQLAIDRSDSYARLVERANNVKINTNSAAWTAILSMALVSFINSDVEMAQIAVDRVMEIIDDPIVVGHVKPSPGRQLAKCAFVFDLCNEFWSPAQKAAFYTYMNDTIDANVGYERTAFHNGWYSYKNWGIGLACYATYYDNASAPGYLETLRTDWVDRVAPSCELAGGGGGWAEGYYINYFIDEWLIFCEAALLCEGVDYYADAPNFLSNRAVASMFETYPGIRQENSWNYDSRRPIPMGDGGPPGASVDRSHTARRILVNHYINDTDHQMVHAFSETTPMSKSKSYAFSDFLYRDTSITQGNLSSYRLSHYSPGPGYISARSSWDEDATYFFFKCGDRFTSHQHLDVGQFLIYKYESLVGDGGYYSSIDGDSWKGTHIVNYYLRSIAHNTILVSDPNETWRVRNTAAANDGGQAFPWAGNENTCPRE